MAQVQNSYKYGDSPTVYGTVNGQQYAFSNANDFTSLGGNFSNVQTLSGPSSPSSKNLPIYSSSSNSTPTLGSLYQPDTGSSVMTASYNPSTGGTTSPTSTLSSNQAISNTQAQQPSLSGTTAGNILGNNYLQNSMNQPMTGTPGTSAGSYGGYDSSGNLASFQNPLEKTQPAPDIQAQTPSNITPSTSLGGGGSNSAILAAFNKSLGQLGELASSLSQFQQPSAAEQGFQKQSAEAAGQVGQAQMDVNKLEAEAAGAINPSGNPDLAFVTGSARNNIFLANQNVISAQLKQQVAQMQLAYAQGNREFAFNAGTKIFDAQRQNLLDTLQVYTTAAPQNVATTYNPYTGDITGTFRSPLTGEQWSGVVGNAGIQKKYIDSGVANVAGIPTFYGVTPSGQKEFQSLLPSIQGALGGQTTTLDTNGNVQGLGQVSIPGYGGAVNPQTGQPYRTDRNNNPIAMAVSTGGSNQFTKALDAAGIKWTYGDTFPNNPNMSTVKVLGNGLEAARAVLSNTNALSGWYANSTGKQILSQYGISNAQQFAKADTATQNAIIDGIYKAEGGSGILTHSQAQKATSPQQIVEQASQILPFLSGNVPKTFNGHYYVDTTKLSPEAYQAASTLLPYYSQQAGMPNAVSVLNPADVQDVRTISNTMSQLNTLNQLVMGLPDNAFGPDRIKNAIATKFQSDKQLAQINALWSTAIGALQAQGAQSSRIGQAMIKNDLLASLPNSTTPRQTALALIQEQYNNLNNVENNIFGSPPPPDIQGFNQKILSSSTQQNDSYLSYINNFLGGNGGMAYGK